jgi:hypothetical protein
MIRLVCYCLTAFCLLAPATRAQDKKEKAAGIVIDKEKKTITIPAKVAPRKIDAKGFDKIYPIEVIATYPYPRGKKAHETVVTIEVKPSEVHKALEGLGLKPGKPAKTADDKQTGPEVKIYIQVGKAARRPVESFLIDQKTEKPLTKVKWLFTGSAKTRPDKDKPEVYGANDMGTLIAIFPVTADTVIQSSLSLADEKFVKLETNTKLPKVGTAVSLIIEVVASK